MKIFKKLIESLNKLKKVAIFGGTSEELSDQEKEYLDRIPKQNPYGLIGLILGGIAFVFGPEYGFIPVMTLVFCMVTLFTFDRETEDNPWTFYLGIILALIGLIMFIIGELHHLIF